MKVLIFTVTAGNGHNSTAKVFKNKFENMGNHEVKIVDVYKTYGSKLQYWTIDKGYAYACNYFVGFYNFFFKQDEKNKTINQDISFAHKYGYNIMKGMLNEIYDYKPDIIISTHVFANIALSDLKMIYNIPAKIYGLTLDYGISPYWECATNIDTMFLSGEYMKPTFIKKGYTDSQLVSLGIPINENFSKQIDKTDARTELNLDTNLFTLIIMKASFFAMSNIKIIKELEKIEKPIQIVIVNGKIESDKKQLDKLIEKSHSKHKYINLGFVNNINTYFSASDLIFGKAGGLTTSEAIAKNLPSLIINKLPEQEIKNKQYLINNGCALSIDNKNTLSKTINHLLSNISEYYKMVENLKKIQQENVIDKFYNYLIKSPKADYSTIKPLIDTKSKIIKTVKSALKKNYKTKKTAISLKKSKKIKA